MMYIWTVWYFPSLSCYMVYYPLVSVLQATAEQIRLAQMIYDKNDADFEDKVNQVRNSYNNSLLPVIHCKAGTFWVLDISNKVRGILSKVRLN